MYLMYEDEVYCILKGLVGFLNLLAFLVVLLNVFNSDFIDFFHLFLVTLFLQLILKCSCFSIIY